MTLALPEFSVPSVQELIGEIRPSQEQLRAALIAAGVSEPVIDAFGLDLLDVNQVLDTLRERGISFNLNSFAKVLLQKYLINLESAVNDWINSEMPKDGVAFISIEGTEGLQVNSQAQDLDAAIVNALGQLSLHVDIQYPFPKLSEITDSSQGGSTASASMIEKVLGDVQLVEVGLRTMSASEPVVTKAKIVASSSRSSVLRSRCEAGQPKWNLISELHLSLQETLLSTSPKLLMSYSKSGSTDVCGIVAQSPTETNLRNALIDGGLVNLSLDSGFPLQSVRILPAGKVRISGKVDLPGSVLDAISASKGSGN